VALLADVDHAAALRAPHRARHGLAQRGLVPWREQVRHPHAQQRIARVAVVRGGRVVRVQEGERERIENPHGLWVGLEEEPVELRGGGHPVFAVGHDARC
jgi:hypothetical protein